MTVGGYVALNGEHKAALAAALMTVRGYVAFNGENKAPTRYKTAAVSLGNWIDARIEARADERFHAGQCNLLILGVRQVDHLGDKVAAKHLVEIFLGELHRDGVMRTTKAEAEANEEHFDGKTTE